jgi:cobalt-zinc-cadmium efflux system membrane fusion protein
MLRYPYKIITVILVFTLYSCVEKKEQPDQRETSSTSVMDNRIKITQAQFKQSKMLLGNLEQKSFPTVVNVNGMIDVPPENRAVVNATMGGYIKTTPLLVGDAVRKGQVLATIENPEFVMLQQEYMEVNEQLIYLKSEYDRQITMKAENITSQKSYLKAESEYRTAVATHTGLDKQLRMIHISPAKVREGSISSIVSIYAPISGSITKMNVTMGSYVSPATEILEIIDSDHIHLELSVFEKDIMKIKKGQRINFKIPESSMEIYGAEVHLVGTSIDANRTIRVHGHLNNDADHNFLTGMFVNAGIITDSAFAKAVPNQAVVEVDEVFYVLVLDKIEGEVYYFKQVEVVVEKSYEGFMTVQSEAVFTPQTQFLIKGAFNLLGE